MPLDPTISLKAGQGITQFDPYGTAKGALSLVDLMQKVDAQPRLLEQKLKTEQALHAHQLLENEELQKKVDTKKKMSDIFKANKKAYDKEKGLIEYDHDGIRSMILLDPTLDHETAFETGNKLFAAEQAHLKTNSEIEEALNKQFSFTSNLLANLPEGSEQKAGEMVGATIANAAKTPGVTQDMMKKYGTLYFGERPPAVPGPDGNVIQPPPGVIGKNALDHSKNIVAAATISPQQKLLNRSVGISEEQWNDDKSAIQQIHQDILVKNGLPKDLVSKLTYAQVRNNPLLVDLIKESVIPGAERGGYRASATAESVKLPFINQVERVAEVLASKGHSDVPLANFLDRTISLAGVTDADRETVRLLIDQAKEEGIPIPANATPKALIAQMRSQREIATGKERLKTRESQRGINVGVTSPTEFKLGANVDLSKVREKMVQAKVPQEELEAFDAKYGDVKPQFSEKKYTVGDSILMKGIRHVVVNDQTIKKHPKGTKVITEDGRTGTIK